MSGRLKTWPKSEANFRYSSVKYKFLVINAQSPGFPGFTVRHKIAQTAETALHATGTVDEADDVPIALLASELFGDDDVAIACEAGTGSFQIVLIYELARNPVKQNIVADADEVGSVEVADAPQRFARNLAVKFLCKDNALLVG